MTWWLCIWVWGTVIPFFIALTVMSTIFQFSYVLPAFKTTFHILILERNRSGLRRYIRIGLGIFIKLSFYQSVPYRVRLIFPQWEGEKKSDKVAHPLILALGSYRQEDQESRSFLAA